MHRHHTRPLERNSRRVGHEAGDRRGRDPLSTEYRWSNEHNSGENTDRPHETFHHDGSPKGSEGVPGATKMPAAGRDVNSTHRHVRVTPTRRRSPPARARAATPGTRARPRE